MANTIEQTGALHQTHPHFSGETSMRRLQGVADIGDIAATTVYMINDDDLDYEAPVKKTKAVRCKNSVQMSDKDVFEFYPGDVLSMVKYHWTNRYRRITDAVVEWRPMIQAGTNTTGYIYAVDKTLKKPEDFPLIASKTFDLGVGRKFKNITMPFGIDSQDGNFPVIFKLKVVTTSYKKSDDKGKKKIYGSLMSSFRVMYSSEPLPVVVCAYTEKTVIPLITSDVEDRVDEIQDQIKANIPDSRSLQGPTHANLVTGPPYDNIYQR